MVDDVVADFCEELIREVSPVSGHCILACDSPECYCFFVSPFVAHHTHALYRKEDDSCLPYLVVEACLASILAGGLPLLQSADEDVISFLRDSHFLAGDITEDAHCKSRSRERMSPNKMFRHSHLTANPAHFIFEEPFQRLTKA